jgi:hypothetical protein
MYVGEKPERKKPLGRQRLSGSYIKMDLREKDRVLRTGLIWPRIGAVEGSCEHHNKPFGSTKCWEVLEWLHNWRTLKKC